MKDIPLTCPKCGAPNASQKPVCEYCGAVFAAVPEEPEELPSDFGNSSETAVSDFQPGDSGNSPNKHTLINLISGFAFFTYWTLAAIGLVCSLKLGKAEGPVGFGLIFAGWIMYIIIARRWRRRFGKAYDSGRKRSRLLLKWLGMLIFFLIISLTLYSPAPGSDGTLILPYPAVLLAVGVFLNSRKWK